MAQTARVFLLLSLCACYFAWGIIQSHPSPEGTHHGKSAEHFDSIRSQPADSLKDRFLEQYSKVVTNGKLNGYFSQDGVPYYSVETLMVDPDNVDYGHETTSAAYSEYIWLTAMNIWASGSTSDFVTAWSSLDKYIIPSKADQPTCSSYDPSTPAQYVPEENFPSDYPVEIDRNVKTGQDDLNDELAPVYGSISNNELDQFYATHWLLDVDNIYEFGMHESSSKSDKNVYIKTFGRGPEESVWETIPHPSWETFKYGGKCGYFQLFIYDPEYSCDEEWSYINKPEADATTIQATYWAYNFSKGGVSSQVAQATKLSDFIRYSMFDGYLKEIPCYNVNCPAVSFQNGWNASSYLIGFNIEWGGPITDTYWGWRVGSSIYHQGHQNAMTAWILSTIPAFESKTSGGKGQWAGVRYKTLDFWDWLQTDQGAIAGGATNSFNGTYDNPTKNGITGYFNGMAYDWEPGHHNPPSNNWFGWQTFSQERNAEYCFMTGDTKSCNIIKKWVQWIMSLKNNILLPNNDYQVPSNLTWFGQPNNYTGTDYVQNPDLKVEIVNYTKDVGVASVLAHVLTYYAAASGDSNSQTLARELLDRIYMYNDSIGIGVNETRQDYVDGFITPVYVPSQLPNGEPVNYGRYPDGAKIVPNTTFIGLRPWYKNDPSWPKIESSMTTGIAPVFIYHRMWAQAQFGIACGDYARLFGNSSEYYVGFDNDLYIST